MSPAGEGPIIPAMPKFKVDAEIKRTIVFKRTQEVNAPHEAAARTHAFIGYPGIDVVKGALQELVPEWDVDVLWDERSDDKVTVEPIKDPAIDRILAFARELAVDEGYDPLDVEVALAGAYREFDPRGLSR